MDRLPSPFPFIEAIESLRALKNSRWALYSSPESDSLYEQMYQMALVCLAHPDVSLARLKSQADAHRLNSSVAKMRRTPL